MLSIRQYLFADGGSGFAWYCLFGGDHGNKWIGLLYNCHLLCSYVFFIGQRDTARVYSGVKSWNDGRKENGIACVYKFCMLGTNCILWINSTGRSPAYRCGQIKDIACLLLSAKFMRRSIFVCNSNITISTWFIYTPFKVIQCSWFFFCCCHRYIEFVNHCESQFFTFDILDTECFRKLHNNTKWIILYQRHIKRVQYHY